MIYPENFHSCSVYFNIKILFIFFFFFTNLSDDFAEKFIGGAGPAIYNFALRIFLLLVIC